MWIIINEIRKILNWKILLVLAFVNLIIYFLLIDFDIEHYPNGRPALDSYKIGVEMIHNYGPEMNEKELADFKEKYVIEAGKADEFLQARNDAQKARITSYHAFQNSDLDNQMAEELHSKIMFEEGVDLFWELQERERLIEFHDAKNEIVGNDLESSDSQQKERLKEIVTAGHYAVYPEIAIMNFKSIMRSIAIAVLVSVVLLVSPTLIRDQSLRVLDLQYTAKIGRPIFKKKMVAGLISAFLVMTGLLTVYLALYSQNHPEPFFKIQMNTFIGDNYWYDFTFLQYIILTLLAIYVLGFIIVLISLIVSHLAPNYITVIGLQVPIFFIVLAFGLSYLIDRITSILLPQWFVPLCYSILLLASILYMMTLWKREKKKDILL